MAKNLTEQEKVEIIEKYQTGNYSCGRLAIEYNKRDSSIIRFLHKSGIKVNNDRSKLARKYTLNENYFDVIDTEEKAYFLGLMYADGCNHEKTNVASISLQTKDKSLLEKFNIAIESNRPLYCYELSKKNINWQNSYTLNMSSRKITSALSNLGCISNKSLILDFPTEDQISSNLIRHFIRGFIDGDGCISYSRKKSTGRPAITCSISSTKEFCEKFKNFVSKVLEINFTCYKAKKNIDSNVYSSCSTSNKGCLIFLKWLYSDTTIYMERKYHKYLSILEMLKEIGRVDEQGLYIPVDKQYKKKSLIWSP